MSNTNESKYATKLWPYGTKLTAEAVLKAKARIARIQAKELPNLVCEVESMKSGKWIEYTIKDLTKPENHNIIERYFDYDSGKFYFHNWLKMVKHAYEPA